MGASIQAARWGWNHPEPSADPGFDRARTSTGESAKPVMNPVGHFHDERTKRRHHDPAPQGARSGTRRTEVDPTTSDTLVWERKRDPVVDAESSRLQVGDGG
jgi:hypothetical protein